MQCNYNTILQNMIVVVSRVYSMRYSGMHHWKKKIRVDHEPFVKAYCVIHRANGGCDDDTRNNCITLLTHMYTVVGTQQCQLCWWLIFIFIFSA